MLLTIFIGALILFFLFGVPVAFSIGLTSLIVLIVQRGLLDIPHVIVAQRMMYGVNSFPLLAVPLFILAGNLMNIGGITRRIFNFANSVVGWWPGGLGHANVIASMIFAGMSGSAVADAAGLGKIEVKAMLDEGYDRDFSAAITAASSTIGPIIPPSIPLVIFGVMGDVSVGALLIGGIVPGVMMGLSLIIMIFWMARKREFPKRQRPRLKELLRRFLEAFLPMLTPIILVGGILSGIFTPTEAAAVCVLYALILCTAVYREISLHELYETLVIAMKDTVMVLFIVACASLYAWLLIRARIPIVLAEKMFSITQDPLIILLILNLFFLIVGCFMESLAAITILTPILVPFAKQVGIDPLHLGLVMVLNLMIGLLTPPIGMCLFAVSRVADLPFERLVKSVAPFYLPLIAVLLLITIFPQLVTYLPNLLLRR